MKPLPGLIQSLESYVEGCGTRVHRAALPDFVHGRAGRDLITLRSGLTPLQEFAALVHEITHWLVHQDPCGNLERTVFEYEAEAVEALVLGRLGLAGSVGLAGGHGLPTDRLLPASVQRVRVARGRICAALGVVGDEPARPSEAQTAVDFQTAAGEEIVFEYERYGMGDFLGLPEAL